MQQMLDQLSRDHRQIEKHLVSLEELQAEPGPLSLDMLHSMLTRLHGLQHENVQDHHNLEDRALDLLKSRYRISDIMISAMERDHTRLDSAAANATAVVRQALNDPANRPTEGIKLRMIEFTEAYRNHIRTEEDVIFPMIQQLIAEQAMESTGSWKAMSA